MNKVNCILKTMKLETDNRKMEHRMEIQNLVNDDDIVVMAVSKYNQKKIREDEVDAMESLVEIIKTLNYETERFILCSRDKKI